MKSNYRILVLDDNPVFLKTYHHKLSRHAKSLELLWNCRLDIEACTTTAGFFRSVTQQPDLLILDYRLEDGLKADTLLRMMSAHGVKVDSVIISESQPEFSDRTKEMQQIAAVLRKDSLLIPRSCAIIEEQLFRHINQA